MPPPPEGRPSVAQGMAVLTLLLAFYIVPVSLAQTPWWKLRTPTAHVTKPVCQAPVEIDDGHHVRLGCATELALQACRAQALDAVRLRNHDCTVERGGLRAAWRMVTGHPIDVNRASEADLSHVPGLSARQAAALVGYRREHGPFTALEALRNVPGIGPATAHNLAPWLAVML